MASTVAVPYRDPMAELAQVLADRFVAIRKAVAGTQERFAEKAGIRQATVSKLETAAAWRVIAKRIQWLRKAGADPRELMPDTDHPELAEIRMLLPFADEELRSIILTLLRRRRSDKAARAE